MADSLSSIYNSLNSAYDPQRDLYNQQLGQVDQQTQAAQSGLQQQETNAFTGINNSSNANGTYYSGVTPSEEQTYVGGTYLPALANLQSSAQNQKFGIQQALAGVGVNQTNQANQIYGTQTAQDAQNNYYAQQLAMQKAYNSSYGGSSSSSAASNPYSVSYNSAGGLAFTNNGQPITAAQYAAATGTTVNNLLAQSKTSGDQAILQQMAAAKTTAQQNAIKAKYPQVFGGV